MSVFEEMLNALEELGFLESNTFKSRAYKNARSVLLGKGEESFMRRNHFADIPGIGKSIESKILEFKSTGKIDKLNELRLKNPNKLNPKYYKVRKSYITKKIPLNQAMHLYESILLPVINDSGVSSKDVTLCGSARRGKEYIGDLDIVINTTNPRVLSKVKSCLEKSGFSVTVSGDKKLSFIIDKSNMTPVDIYVTKPEDYYYAVLYLTGSGNFNIKMRATAKKKGFILNQYNLTDSKGVHYKAESEKEIFDLIGMPYVEPNKRDI